MKGTIKSSGEIGNIFQVGQRINTESFMALIQKRDNRRGLSGRVAFIAGKRLGTAPVRNRAKRRMREAAQCYRASWSDYDVVLVAKRGATSARYESISRDMRQIQRALSQR